MGISHGDEDSEPEKLLIALLIIRLEIKISSENQRFSEIYT